MNGFYRLPDGLFLPCEYANSIETHGTVVSQMSFRRENSGGITKCQLFSQGSKLEGIYRLQKKMEHDHSINMQNTNQLQWH